MREFVSSIPYQAVTTQDSISRQAVFSESGKKRVRVNIANAPVAVGDPVQWIVL